jgi:Zn-dependent M28 family amino/carboxypeptidase
MNKFFIFVISIFLVACKSGSSSDTSKDVIAKTPTVKKYKKRELLFDSALVVQTLKTLSSDEYEGRKTGTKGHELAKSFVISQFDKISLKKFGDSFEHKFNAKMRKGDVEASNLVGYLKGTDFPESYLVIGAHYDHIGIQKGKVFNGADDNASGVGALLGIANYFKQNPPKHSLIFIAFDVEEMGLQGSNYITKNFPVDLSKVSFMLNMDMISQNSKSEIYASGTNHNPDLLPVLKKLDKESSEISLLYGHDQPKIISGVQDWTNSSDHAAFHKAKIPYIYFGVEDHKHYHKSTDTFQTIDLNFYMNSVNLILKTTKAFDETLD